VKDILTVVVIVLLGSGIAIFVLKVEEKRQQRLETAEELKKAANRE
jgi:hypothetical protein